MKGSEKPRIVIADDHPIVREGLREIIERDGRFAIVGEAGDGAEAWRLIQLHTPHVAVLDVEMPLQSGLDVAQAISAASLPVAVLILTMFNQESVFNRAMKHGVLGYILKDSVGADVVRGLHAVLLGEHFISPSLIGHALRARTAQETQDRRKRGLDDLTSSERKVFELIKKTKSTNQIAEALSVSPRTVEHHREHICQKLNLSGSYALLRYALELQEREQGS